MSFEAALCSVLDELALDPSRAQFAALCRHYRLLVHWNRRINLTRVVRPDEAARRHFGESLFLHRALESVGSLVDVGSGGGFPGLPVAVMRPQALVTLVEATQKKAAFLREAASELSTVSVLDCRIESWEGRADWAVMRAVQPVKVLPTLVRSVRGVAFLGTDPPPTGGFGPWSGRRLPWSDRRRLWTAPSRDYVSRET